MKVCQRSAMSIENIEKMTATTPGAAVMQVDLKGFV
jgi:hypothetical protein